MAYQYNTKYFHDGKLHQLNPKATAFFNYITSDGLVIGAFQGNRGQFPELDFRVKVLKPGENERPFMPPHVLWVVDLMMKIEQHRNEIKEIIEFYIKFYNDCKPFENLEERNKYVIVTAKYLADKYKHIEQKNTLSLEYVCVIIELFCLNEKRTNNAYFFKTLLEKIKAYCEHRCDYIDLLQSTAPGYSW